MFFFAKKNQKTFARLAAEAQATPGQTGKSFLLLFFKKEALPLLFLSTFATSASATPGFSLLYQFTNGADGGYPLSGVIWGNDGALYGTANNGGTAPLQDGTVFRLAPPTGGGTPWTLQTLYSFTGGDDGAQPEAGLVSTASGSLIGTTQNRNGLGTGTAFRLDPPAASGAPWTMTTLLAFDGTGTASPAATLLANKTGGFNGTSAGGAYGKGNVFTLAPPIHAKGTWHATTLYSFTGKADGAFPHCRLISGADGSLWGTTPIGGAGVYTGVVFRLTPPAKGKVKWRYQVLYRFRGGHDGSQPYPGLVFDPQGAAYGVTWSGGLYNAGTIFQVKQTAPGVWSESILYNFGGGADSNPNSALLRDHAGNLYGTASGVSQSYETGELFKLIPPAQAGYGWGFSVLHHFSGADGGDPGGDLLAGPGNALIGTTYYGGQSDTGTVYRFAP